MDEYTFEVVKEGIKEAKKVYQESITDYAKNLVAHIMGTEKDKSKIDSKLEVDLLNEIREKLASQALFGAGR